MYGGQHLLSLFFAFYWYLLHSVISHKVAAMLLTYLHYHSPHTTPLHLFVAASYVAMLVHLLQAVLDWVQLASVYASLDVTYTAPGWVASSLFGMLLSPQSTTSWVSWDCLMPRKLPVSSAALGSLFSILLPGMNLGHVVCWPLEGPSCPANVPWAP